MSKVRHFKCCTVFFFAPAIHLLSLKVASIFEQLNIIEEEADHPFCFFQICLHLCCVLSRFPWAQHPHILPHRDEHVTALHVAVLISGRIIFVCQKGLCLTVCSRVSTWLSCSSHTPDSIWTLLTTLWSRSSLHWGRSEVKGQKTFSTR